jgi:hypothetical protein|tara:strand:- start:180 stop:572 length:393 start_codon:yes stop_codon:yes gene_type:complete
MIKLKNILNESKFAFDRKFGESLPTLKDVTEKHQTESKEQLISEKKELGGALINKIDDLTNKNAHNMARLTLAKAMRNKILMKNYEALMTLHTKFRDMSDLKSARDRLDKELFTQAKKMYSDYEQIHGVF